MRVVVGENGAAVARRDSAGRERGRGAPGLRVELRVRNRFQAVAALDFHRRVRTETLHRCRENFPEIVHQCFARRLCGTLMRPALTLSVTVRVSSGMRRQERSGFHCDFAAAGVACSRSSKALRVLPSVCSSDSFGMLVTYGPMIGLMMKGMSRVSVMPSHWT